MLRKEFKTEIISPVAICDVEISNDIVQPDGSWDYTKSDIITLGIFYGNKITILQKEKTDSLDFWKNCLRRELESMPVMFCLNVRMEKGAVIGFLGMNRFFEEILPFVGKGCAKENLFKDLVKNNEVEKCLIPEDPLKGKSVLVLDKYAENKYEEVILHNKSCLIKEYFIFMKRFWFLEKYKDKINKGWWNGEKPFGEHY